MFFHIADRPSDRIMGRHPRHVDAVQAPQSVQLHERAPTTTAFGSPNSVFGDASGRHHGRPGTALDFSRHVLRPGESHLFSAVGRPATVPRGGAPQSLCNVPGTGSNPAGQPPPEPFFSQDMPQLHGNQYGSRQRHPFPTGANPVHAAQRRQEMFCKMHDDTGRIMTTPDGRRFKIFGERPPPPSSGKGTNMVPTYDWAPQPKMLGDREEDAPYAVDPAGTWRYELEDMQDRDALEVGKGNFNGDFYDGVGPQPEDSELPQGYDGYQKYAPVVTYIPPTNADAHRPRTVEGTQARDDLAWTQRSGHVVRFHAKDVETVGHGNRTTRVVLREADPHALKVFQPQGRSNPQGPLDLPEYGHAVTAPDRLPVPSRNRVMEADGNLDGAPKLFERTQGFSADEPTTTNTRMAISAMQQEWSPDIDNPDNNRWAETGAATQFDGSNRFERTVPLDGLTGHNSMNKVPSRLMMEAEPIPSMRNLPTTEAPMDTGLPGTRWGTDKRTVPATSFRASQAAHGTLIENDVGPRQPPTQVLHQPALDNIVLQEADEQSF
jgi:hypothetical protein